MREQILPLVDGERSRLQAGDTTTLRGPNRMSFDIKWNVDKLGGSLDDNQFRRKGVIEELVTAVLGKWRYGVTKTECPL